MEFSLIDKREVGGISYKLLKSNFHREGFAIVVQSKNDFACGSVCGLNNANALFEKISESATEPQTLLDILCDINKQRV